MANFLKVGSTVLPTPTSLTVKKEPVWSSDTGRTQSGKMSGNVVAEKITASVKWNVLPKSKMDLIEKHLKLGFFSVTLNDLGTFSAYRGPIQAERWNRGNGEVWYRNISIDLIER